MYIDTYIHIYIYTYGNVSLIRGSESSIVPPEVAQVGPSQAIHTSHKRQQTYLLSDTADCCLTQHTSLLCDTADTSAVRHSRLF